MRKTIDVLLFLGLIVALNACSENTKNKMSDDIKEAKQAVGFVTNQIADDTKEAWKILKDSVKDSRNEEEGEQTEKEAENLVGKASEVVDEVSSQIADAVSDQ